MSDSDLQPAARQDDPHCCSDESGLPNANAHEKIKEGSPNITINNKPAACVGHKVSCRYDEEAEIAEGSKTVFYNGKPAARVGDKTKHGGSISGGSSNVSIGSGGNHVYFGSKGTITIGNKGKVNIGGGGVTGNSTSSNPAASPATAPSLGGEAASLGLDLTPGIGTIKSGVQVVTGEDVITGEPVDRLTEAAGVVLSLAPGGKALVKCQKIEKTASKIIIKAEEIMNKTRTEIRELAEKKGLKPIGDKNAPDYPRKWADPDTNQQRLRLDKGHIDRKSGLPYDKQNASVDHVHAYDEQGNPIIDPQTGDNHLPTNGE